MGTYLDEVEAEFYKEYQRAIEKAMYGRRMNWSAQITDKAWCEAASPPKKVEKRLPLTNFDEDRFG